MKKRLLSLFLVVLMVMSILPVISATAISFSGTTGDGTSANPIVCDNFSELKKVLEYKTDEAIYVKLVANSQGVENLPTLTVGAPAITSVGTKYLNVEGESEFVAAKKSNNDCFIEIDGKLNITGTGKLIYTHNSAVGSGAVLSLKDGDEASLVIQSGVTIYGKASSSTASKDWFGARALWANSGAVLIDGAKMYGSVSKLDFDYSYYNATELTGSVHAYFMSGTFSAMDLSNMTGYTYTPNAPLIVSLGIRNLDSDASINLLGGTYFGIQHKGINTADLTTNNYVFFDDYNKVIKKGTDNVLLSYMPHEDGYMFEGSFDNTLTYAPITVLRVVAPEIIEWEPFYNNGKSSMDITLLKGKQYTFNCNCDSLSDALSERGFLVKRSYVLEDTAAGKSKNYYVTGTNYDLSFDYTFEKNGTAKYQVCIEILFKDTTVSKRYYTYNITVSDKETISNAEFAFVAPIVGRTPGAVSVVGGEVDYDFEGAWYELNGYYDNGMPKVGAQLTSSDKFVSGKQYMAAVRIGLSDNLEFCSDFVGYINGKKAKIYGNFSTAERGTILWVPFVPYEKEYYLDLDVVIPKEGEIIGSPILGSSVGIPVATGIVAKWTDENGNEVSGEFVGGRKYYLNYILRSIPNTSLPNDKQADIRVNGVAPDEFSIYNASSGNSQIMRIVHEFYCVDEIEFYFTSDSYCEAGGTMTVDIERIVEQSDELVEAYFEDDYSVQWYRDGKALEGAIGLALSFQQRDTLYTYSCELTIGDTVLMSEEYLCETHIHKYGESYENDEEEHWHGCTDADCPDYDGSIVGGAHVYDNDGGCAVCGYGTYLVGDVNEDGYIDNLDAAMLLKYDAGIIDLDASKLALADVNKDGYADNLDAAMILKYDAGIIDSID